MFTVIDEIKRLGDRPFQFVNRGSVSAEPAGTSLVSNQLNAIVKTSLHDTLAAFRRSDCLTASVGLSTPTRSAIPSYYGLAFLLPKYYKEMLPDTEGFVYIFSAMLGVVIAPGA